MRLKIKNLRSETSDRYAARDQLGLKGCASGLTHRVAIRWLAWLICGLWVLPAGSLSAQESNIWQTDTVRLSSYRLQALASGHRLMRFDSLLLREWRAANLSELLAQHSDVFIKSYGINGLATTSLRGAGASHTAVLWNGFSIPSPMNGQLDLSLIPLFFVDDLQVQYGGSAALFGSGAVGGALHLGSHTPFGAGTRVAGHMQAGSFGRWQPGLDVQVSRKNWLSRTRLYHHRAENDFPLVDAYRDQAPLRERQVHAATRQNSLMQENALRIDEHQTVRAWLWLQETDRQLPPTLTQDSSVATQQDQSLRLALAWERRDLRWDWTLRSGLFREALRYTDSVARIFSDNRSSTLLTQAEGTWRMRPGHSLDLGLMHQWQRGLADGYGEQRPEQTQVAAFLSYRYHTPGHRWQASANLRQEWLPGQWLPLLPSLNLRGKLLPALEIHGQIGRSFRLPTFNDRYWSPGGNPDLRPEQGWGSEIGLRWQPRRDEPWQAELGITVFRQQIEQWILWRPTRQGFWSPENLQNVRSQGLESQAKLTWQRGPWQATLHAAYTQTHSVVTEVARTGDQSLGQQLIYTPLHQGQGGLKLSYAQWDIRYQHAYTGQRLTATDGSASLPAYDLGTFSLHRLWQWGPWQSEIGLRLDNLWNEAYQVMANRPMPLRQVRLSLVIER